MSDENKTTGYGGHVSCHYCRKHLPKDQALQPEAEEYVMYFCGLECYEAWRRASTQDRSEDD